MARWGKGSSGKVPYRDRGYQRKFANAVRNSECVRIRISVSELQPNIVRNLLALNKNDVKNQLQQLELRHEARTSDQQTLLLDIRDRINNATHHITSGSVTLSKIADALRLDWLRQLGSELKLLMHRVVATNIATYHAVISLQTALPSRLERTLIEEPFILEDPIGRIAPVHLQFVTSWDAFNSVLEIRFHNLQGFKKIKNKQYGLQEKATQRDIDQSRAWERAFLPGQRIEMSFVFRNDESSTKDANTTTCPGCQAPSLYPPETEVQCPKCNMWFRRIIVVTDVEPPPSIPLPTPWKSVATFGNPGFSAQLSGPLRPGKRRVVVDDLEGEDDVREFKRVRLVAEKKRVKQPRSAFVQRPSTQFSTLPVTAKLNSDSLREPQEQQQQQNVQAQSDQAAPYVNNRYQPQVHAFYSRAELARARKFGLTSKSSYSQYYEQQKSFGYQAEKFQRRHSISASSYNVKGSCSHVDSFEESLFMSDYEGDIQSQAESSAVSSSRSIAERAITDLLKNQRPGNTLFHQVLEVTNRHVSREEAIVESRRAHTKAMGRPSSPRMYNSTVALYWRLILYAKTEVPGRHKVPPLATVRKEAEELRWILAALDMAAKMDASGAECFSLKRLHYHWQEQSSWKKTYRLPRGDLSGLRQLSSGLYDLRTYIHTIFTWLPSLREEISSFDVKRRIEEFSIPLDLLPALQANTI
jgi:hypothetical protein